MVATTRDDATTRHSHRAFAHQSRILDELRALRALPEIVHPSPSRRREMSVLQEAASLTTRGERLQVVGELTAEFCHQIRTPLASLTLYAEQLDKSTPEAVRLAEKVSRGIYDIRRLANNMLGFAAGGREGRETIRIVNFFDDVAKAYCASRSEASALHSTVADASLTILANNSALQGAVLNLINNARQSGNRTTSILLHARRVGEVVQICVTDDGPGIPANLQGRLFEPFFTTRPQGTGLGLSIVESVAREHGGSVTFESSQLGTTFTLEIPCVDGGESLE